MVKSLFKWIAKHQVLAFFIITFLITWGLGFSYKAIGNGKYLVLPLMFTATCGPALAGVIVACISGVSKPSVRRRGSWIAFIISWIIVTLVFILNHLLVNKGQISAPLIVLVAVSSLPVAFIVNLVYTRFPVISGFNLSPRRSAVTSGWIITALLLFPLLTIIAAVAGRVMNQEVPSSSALPATGFSLVVWIIIKFLSQFFFFNGTGEEAGWRGFALPRLQAYVSPLVAGLILALLWVPWHFFLWGAEGREVLTLSFWAGSYLLHIPSSIILCWIYNRSGGSILAAGVAHASANTIVTLIQPLNQNILEITFFVFVVAIVLFDRMWKRLPADHPAVYKVD